VRTAMTSALGRLERRLETPAQREARLEPRRARDALRRASDEGQVRTAMTSALLRLERRLETSAQREARLEPGRARAALRRASDEGQVRDAMTSALLRLERRLETPAQREARLKPSRDARDALLAEHGSTCDCKTKCLKLHCLCFAKGVPCGDWCTCSFCENVEGSAALREAREASKRLQRKRPKRRLTGGGCHCKKSRCLKRYCDCFREDLKCIAACVCVDCQNGRPADAPAVEAIAAPSKKRTPAVEAITAPSKKRTPAVEAFFAALSKKRKLGGTCPKCDASFTTGYFCPKCEKRLL